MTCGERFYDRARALHVCTREEHPEAEAHASDDADEWVMTDVEVDRELAAICAAVGGRDVFHAALVRSLGQSIREGERSTVKPQGPEPRRSAPSGCSSGSDAPGVHPEGRGTWRDDVIALIEFYQAHEDEYGRASVDAAVERLAWVGLRPKK